MKCLCLPIMVEVIEKLAEMQLALPPIPAAEPGAMGLASTASGVASLAAAGELAGTLEAAAQVTADMALPSPEALANLEAMAQVSGAFGMNLTGPSAQGELSLAAGTINVNEGALGELAAVLPPLLEPLAGLDTMLSAAASLQGSLGVNLGLPGAGAELSSALSASAEGAASVTGALDVSVAADLGTLGRLMSASASLGIDLTQPGAGAALEAALGAAANLEVPSMSMTVPDWTSLIGLVSQFGEINSGMSMDLMAPGADVALAANIGAMEANLGTLAANLSAAADLQASMAADVSAAAQLGLSLSGAAPALGADLGSLTLDASALGGLDGLPAMGDMSLAATFAAAFEAAFGVSPLSGTPCPNMFCTAGG